MSNLVLLQIQFNLEAVYNGMKIEDNFGILLAGVGDLFGFISN